MPKRLSVNGICEKALRLIGALSINESAAQGAELDEAIEWLDVMVAHHVAVNRILNLVPTTLAIPLVGGQVTYALTNTASADEPNDGIQFPLQASFRSDAGIDTPVNIISRSEYEEIPDKDTSGQPDRIYIDRLNSPSMKTYPVLGTGVTGTSIQLVVQAFSPDLTVSRGGIIAHEMRVAWQSWMIHQLAYTLGRGPVRKLPQSELNDLKRDCDAMLNDLLQNENREHTGYPRVVDFREF